MLLSDEKVMYAMVFFGGAAEAAMAAKLDLLSSCELETLWENLAPGWKEFYEPAPTGANRDLDALAHGRRRDAQVGAAAARQRAVVAALVNEVDNWSGELFPVIRGACLTAAAWLQRKAPADSCAVALW